MWSTVRNVVLLLAPLVGVASAATAETWGYHEDRPSQPGPSKWVTVAPACGGKSQSPVNLVYHSNSVVNLWGTTDVAPIKLSGSCKGFNLKQLVDVFKWELADATACKLALQLQNGKTYSLLQFHVHTPSEHTIEGHNYNGEIHFVHKEDGGDGLLVVGLLLNAEENVGEYNWVQNILNTMDKGVEGSTVAVDLGVNYVDLINHLVSRSHLFNYSGSLTTPPCSEIVNWWVLNNPLSISME
ncbi:hypothetical protein PybrP1_008062, partial [[Pythium] brassicae (nom. inval.)]